VIEKRLVQWYASDAGIDLDIAEREIVLTYILRILADSSLLEPLVFKGGTAIRKLFLGSQGRFSLDLDFTALGEGEPEDLILDIVGVFHDQTYFGLTFSIPSADYYATSDSCGAEISYQHNWVTSGQFGIQISFRARPLLPIKVIELRRERYFDWLGVAPPEIPSLDLHEIVGEKIRATAQRSRVRDLYDLYQLSSQRFDREVVRRIAVIKCWETNFAFDPSALLERIGGGQYDWSDLRRLVRRGWETPPDRIMHAVQKEYAFLTQLSAEEMILSGDPYGRQKQTYRALVESLQKQHIP
jgi:predicted nucleotidyltransferase component of viral defense system